MFRRIAIAFLFVGLTAPAMLSTDTAPKAPVESNTDIEGDDAPDYSTFTIKWKPSPSCEFGGSRDCPLGV